MPAFGTETPSRLAAGFTVQRTGRFSVIARGSGAAARQGKPAKAGGKQKAAPAASDAPAADAGSFRRRDHLREIELAVQARWAEERPFDVDGQRDAGKPKWMCCFPYPYANGLLHVGHAFTAMKAELAAHFHRLRGYNVLFPFSFHCTGMPIQAAANKLRAELYPEAEEEGEEKQEAGAAAAATELSVEQRTAQRAKGKRSKAMAKGAGMSQSAILAMMVDESEIPQFVDPEHWLRYFPPLGKEDLKSFGMGVDWRRSFITTSTNPYYDSFIRWQFNTLKEAGRVIFGKRPAVYSVLDGQVCADHDRASGEGVGPTEYTIIKLRVLDLSRDCFAGVQGRDVFLAPATLRPETMYGQTNCFVLPEGEYGLFEFGGDVLVMTERAALNMAHQDAGTPEWGAPVCLGSCTGFDLLGLPLQAPMAIAYERVYTLPLLTIKMDKGTGVVTSVPSDAPDDYAALRDLQQKPALRAKFNITDDMVMPFEVVPIIDIPGYGDRAAVAVCDELGIVSQNDKAKLAEAKDRVYLKGFYEGVLKVGSQAGRKVCDAKQEVREEMLAAGVALKYWEPESKVMSRSGEECIVALTDQWFLAYGAEDWKARVVDHVTSDNFETFNPIAQKMYEDVLSRLHEWACSRQFGLGTKLPWDEQWVIESLSDSTIYMAYYTIAHLLQGEDNMDGQRTGPLGLRPEDMTGAAWDFVFLGKKLPKKSPLPKAKLQQMRTEFLYWYPYDLRVSGKDLITNHLTMSLYNHAEIWGDDPGMMPRAFYTNGHVLVDAEKMSKSRGNFLTLRDCIERYGADATRLGLAAAGDGMDDANFALDAPNAAILRLTTEEELLNKIIAGELELREPGANDVFLDRAFENEMNRLIETTTTAFERMRFRDGTTSGYFQFLGARDTYRDGTRGNGVPMRRDLVARWFEAFIAMLAPACPHYAEHMWALLNGAGLAGEGRPASIWQVGWPEAAAYDPVVSRQLAYITDTLHNVHQRLAKEKGARSTRLAIAVATEMPRWKTVTLEFLEARKDPETHAVDKNAVLKPLKQHVAADNELKRSMGQIMKYAAFIAADSLERGQEAFERGLPFDEVQLLNENLAFIQSSVNLEVSVTTAEEAGARNAAPGAPTLVLSK